MFPLKACFLSYLSRFYLLGFLSPRLKTPCQRVLLPHLWLSISPQILLILPLLTFCLSNYFYTCYLKSSPWNVMSELLQQLPIGAPTSNFCPVQFFGLIITKLTYIKYHFEHITSLIKNHQWFFRVWVYNRCMYIYSHMYIFLRKF